MKFEKFEGVIPALLTPYDKHDEVNYSAVDKMVNRLIEQGIGGLFICGSTGEWWYLSPEERMKIAEQVMTSVRGRTKVMVHVGAFSTRNAVALAKHAEKIGAHAISALPPVGASYSPAAIWDHFRAIADSSRLPLYLYHLPQLYGDLITIDKLVEAMDTMPTFAGMKFSSYRIDELIHLKLKAHGRLNILSGCGEQLLSATACGAEGSICTWYNLIPRLANEIIRHTKANRLDEAIKAEELLVNFAMIIINKHIGYMKWLVSQRGIDVGRPRSPMPAPTPDECAAILPKIKATGIWDWLI